MTGTPTEPEESKWHVLPGLIGSVIVSDEPINITAGGYRAYSDEDDIMVERDGELIAKIPAPEDGWNGEVETVKNSIWEGFR